MRSTIKLTMPLWVSLSLASSGCNGDGDPPAAPASTGISAVDEGESGGPADLDQGTSTGVEPELDSGESGLDQPPDDGADVVCELGDSRPCECADGLSGYEICVDVDGAYSACGCATDPDVFEEPEVPEPTQCGEQVCAAMVEEPTEASASPCCTDDGGCGGQSDFIFGAQCVERFGDPGDLETVECPDEFPHFLDLDGCCLPSGACGLSIDYINNWDIGCIERTQMMEMLNRGKDVRAFLALIFLLGPVDVDYAPMACTPA